MKTSTPTPSASYESIETGYQAVRWHEPSLYELTRPGARNNLLPPAETDLQEQAGDVLSHIPTAMRRQKPPPLPELSEPEIMRHFLRLSQQTFGVDSGITLGLGTCTMKYNPKINEQVSKQPTFALLHPDQPEELAQGILQIMYELRNWLCELSGMDEFSFQPRGGAQAIYANACIMRAYHRNRGEAHRDEIITAAVAHPSNAGCPAAAGYKVITLYPDPETGDLGIEQVKAAISERTAGLMITTPYDTGVFDSQIAEYIRIVHEAGGLVSLDQANFNGVMTRLRAKEMGADMMHFNLHKTFSTPHGSSGPATGALGVTQKLRPFLPAPIVECRNGRYHLNVDLPQSIGKIAAFYGVTLNVLKAYAWIYSMGIEGLREAAEWSVINNNYLIKKLLEVRGVGIAWPNRRKLQEARFTLEQLRRETGVTTSEFNQRAADYGILTYFESHHPVIVPEPVTPEAPESVSREDIDRFVEVFRRVSEEAYTNPDIVKTAPHRSAIRKIDPAPLRDASRVITTWRAYLRKINPR
jgi:glycine dehydrogenase subunit 2